MKSILSLPFAPHILKNILPLLLLFSFFSKSISSSENYCSSTSCSPTGPQIRFPFRLRNRQPSSCGFPGFDLTCNNKNETLLHLHPSQSFIVKNISYVAQVIYIQPNLCSPEQINDINLNNTPFDFIETKNYTFFNCSSSRKLTDPMMRPFSCLRSVNHSVFAVQTSRISHGYIPENCSVMTKVSVPLTRFDDVTDELSLPWFTPYCKECESYGGICGMKTSDQFGETDCYGVFFIPPSSSSSSNGIPTDIKYALSIGIGIPALICITWLIFYLFRKANNLQHAHLQSIDLLSIPVTPQPPTTTGLDGVTIQSYPKIVLGESCRLAKGDGICSICLSGYKPKESVRTIPECNHYFHAECIDEWLKLNRTCPVCRNSPETLLSHDTTQS